ncbi:MAG: hypothetical protein ACSNEK_09125 [Parachlamydiaceae bacterium]
MMQKENAFKVHYNGSFFWLFFWMIFFFPIALVLFFTASSFDINQKTYCLVYNGSRFWLSFWTLVFFPIAFVLLFLKGFSIKVVDKEA